MIRYRFMASSSFFKSRTVTVDEADVSLTHTEFEILVYFMKNQNCTNKEQLISNLGI